MKRIFIIVLSLLLAACFAITPVFANGVLSTTAEEIDVTVSGDVNSDGVSDNGQHYQTRLETLYRIYGVEVGEDNLWLEVIGSLEYLDSTHRELFLKYSASARPVGKDAFLERALAYFIYRHLTEAYSEEAFLHA